MQPAEIAILTFAILAVAVFIVTGIYKLYSKKKGKSGCCCGGSCSGGCPGCPHACSTKKEKTQQDKQ